MIVVGVDENGLGPRLGPLVVTAVCAEADARGLALATSPPRARLQGRLGDSKQLVSYGASALGEAWARAIAPGADSPDALMRALCIDSRSWLTRACPSGHAAQCWRDDAGFSSTDAEVESARRDLDALAAAGLKVTSVRLVVACTRALNDAADAGESRFAVDLHAMERLVLDARERSGQHVHAICGKVGGLARYRPAFGPLAGRPCTVREEGPARSAYAIEGVGEIAFVRDADATAAIVGLASLVGKWARDHAMAQIVRWHRVDTPGAPDASGYHDPVTARFVEATHLARRARGLPDTCFERAKARGGSRAT